jgi:hypothetical protein
VGSVVIKTTTCVQNNSRLKMTDLQTSVLESDILKTVQILRGPHTVLKDFKIAPATSVVQGFSSTILRVTANVELSKVYVYQI